MLATLPPDKLYFNKQDEPQAFFVNSILNVQEQMAKIFMSGFYIKHIKQEIRIF
jgi:hypothetical protein